MEILDTIFTYIEYIICFGACIVFISMLIEDKEWKKLFSIIIGVPIIVYLTYLFTEFLDWAFTNHPQACLNMSIIFIVAMVLCGMFAMIILAKELKNLFICFLIVIAIVGMVVLMTIGSMV